MQKVSNTYQWALLRLKKGERFLLGALGGAIVVVVSWGVVVRYTPIPGASAMTAPVEELSKLILVWAVFWGASWIQREDNHYKMAILLDLLSKKTRLVCLIVSNLAVTAFLLLMVINTGPVLENGADMVSMVMCWPVNLWTYGYLAGIGLMLIYTVRRVILYSWELSRACQH